MHLLKHVTIADITSSENGRTVDLRISDGRITEIGTGLSVGKKETIIDLKGAYVSPGFIDIGPYLGDPGHEEREDIESLVAAGLRGGYTALAPLPNTQPIRHDKSGIRYLTERSRGLPVALLPLGAVSMKTEGNDLTEMIDMHHAGAVAFTDGLHPITSAGLLSRALHYVKSFGGTVINQPLDDSLSPGGQLHEGIVSTQLGMRGIPDLSETLTVHRDLELLAYADSRLLLHLISCAKSLELIKAAKAKGLAAFASVAALNLQFTVEQLADFDSNFKVLPPLRAETDRQALVDGVVAGVIDCVVSNHVAHQEEGKKLEFSYADFGSLGLESCFAQASTVLGDRLTPAELAALFSHGPRRSLNLPTLSIEKDAAAELSFFQLDREWTFSREDLAGKGDNSPLLGKVLKGGPVGIYRNGQFHPSH